MYRGGSFIGVTNGHTLHPKPICLRSFWANHAQEMDLAPQPWRLWQVRMRSWMSFSPGKWLCVCVFFVLFFSSLVFVRVIGLDLKAERICYKAFMKCYGTAPLRLYPVSTGISDGSFSEMPLAMYLDTPSSYACLVRICSSEDALMGKHVVLRVGYLSGRGLLAFVGLPMSELRRGFYGGGSFLATAVPTSHGTNELQQQ